MINKFTFTSEFLCEKNPVKNTLEFNAVSLDEILPYVEDFLKGAGYNFEGKLEFVKDFNDETTDSIVPFTVDCLTNTNTSSNSECKS